MPSSKTSSSQHEPISDAQNASHDGKTLDNYRLPPFVEAINVSWRSTANPILIVSGFFTIASLQLLLASSADAQSGMLWSRALRIAGYASVSFNAGASISAVLILDNTGTLTVDAAERALSQPQSIPAEAHAGQPLPKELLSREKHMDLLRVFGIDTFFKRTTIHLLMCFGLGFISLFLQVGFWIWQIEEAFVAQVATALLLFGAFGFINTVVSSLTDATAEGSS